MKEFYEKSIQMIKELKLKLTEREYNTLAFKYNLLSSESLKYITQEKDFNKIIRNVLEEVA